MKLARNFIRSEDIIGQATADFYKVIYLNRKGKTDSARMLVEQYINDKAIASDEALINKFRLAKTGILVRNSLMKEGLENSLSTLHHAENKKLDELEIKAQIQIGWLYMELNQFDEALNWFFKAEKNCKKSGDKFNPSVLYSNIAAVYNSLKKNDSASLFVVKALSLAKKEQDLTFICNASYIYSDICIDLGNMKKAEELLKEGIEIRKKIGDPFYIVSDLAQLGKFYANNKQMAKGIATINEGIAIAKENNLTSKLIFLNTMLAENYKAANDQVGYSNTLNEIIALKDSLYKQNSAQAVSELQTKYELQKKENTIIQQRLDLVQKSYWMYGSLSLLLFGGILWYINFKNNKRKQEQKMALALMEEKRQSEKAILIAEENERKRIAADLHDNLGAYAAAISSNVDTISAIAKNDNVQNVYEELKTNAQSIVSQLNDTIWILTKETLALTAISDRLKVFIQRLHNSYPEVRIDVSETITHDFMLAPLQALHLFKILQEGIINALKHSQCSKIKIAIESNNFWKITIADNGSGIIKNTATGFSSGGNGLFNMKNRSKEAGWTIEWRNNEPSGTIVSILSTTN